MPHCIVVDTNVFAVAGELHDGASDECKLACVRLLRLIDDGQRIAVDRSGAVFAEYLGAVRGCPEPTLASKLAARLWRTRHSDAVCHHVDITPIDPPSGSFADAPDHSKILTSMIISS